MASPVRRSARGAPPTIAKPAPPASTTSSSSLTSGRPDRNSKPSSHQKSVTPHSLSSEEMSEPPRRSQRSHQAKQEEATVNKDANDDADGAITEEEEVTRCICGQLEYPGPPLSEAFANIDPNSEDAGSLFISCDGCSIWQHGGCVGIVEDGQVPDKYFCEECRPKMHELHTDARGQKYSLYVPLHQKSHRKSSMSKHGDKAQKERENTATSRASADPTTGKRRATMRSKEHDAEEEQIQRAIEESRREVEGAASGRRSAKRVRDDSEDSKQEIKRQRTASESIPSLTRTASMEGDSEDEAGNATGGRGKKAKSEAAQTARQSELREKEKERDKARAEAAGRRQERAGRRRGDEGELDETPRPKASPPPSSQPTSPPSISAPEKVSHKKGAGKKTKKLGNNQYTKSRDVAPASPHGKKRPPGTSQGMSSGDEQMVNGDRNLPGTSHGGVGKNSPGVNELGNGVKGRFGKGKQKGANGNGTKNAPQDIADLTIPDMARQVAAMAAFMAKAQVEIGPGERTASSSEVPQQQQQHGEDAGETAATVPPPPSNFARAASDGRKFEELSATEMAEVLGRNLTLWQNRFVAPATTQAS